MHDSVIGWSITCFVVCYYCFCDLKNAAMKKVAIFWIFNKKKYVIVPHILSSNFTNHYWLLSQWGLVNSHPLDILDLNCHDIGG